MLSKRININVCHFLQCLFKMTEYKLYPNLPPSVSPETLGPRFAENPQVGYHVSVIQAKMQELKNKEQIFKQNTRSTLKY